MISPSMIPPRDSNSRRLIFWMAAAIHAVWGLCLLLSADPRGVTGIYVLSLPLPSHVPLGCLLLLVGAMGALGASGRVRGITAAVFLTWQQVTLWVSASGALVFVWQSHYADGVIRSQLFMLPDQFPLMAITLFHTFALLRYYRQVRQERGQ